MELESLFTDLKWNILQTISKKSKSPLEIANKLNTTISNISQQLRLLEVAGLVKKKRVSNRSKGKPRILFSIAKDYTYIISIMNSFTRKKLLTLPLHNKSILQIWLNEDPEVHYYLEKFYWQIETHLPEIQAIAIKARPNIEAIIVSEEKEKLKEKIGEMIIRRENGQKKTFKCFIYRRKEIKNIDLKNSYIFYDPENLLQRSN